MSVDEGEAEIDKIIGYNFTTLCMRNEINELLHCMLKIAKLRKDFEYEILYAESMYKLSIVKSEDPSSNYDCEIDNWARKIANNKYLVFKCDTYLSIIKRRIDSIC